MKKNAFVVCVLVLFALCACEKSPKAAHIDGNLQLSEGIELSDFVGEELYLYHTMGMSVGGCVDSCRITSELSYAFNDLAFGAYSIGISSRYTLDPDTLVFRMSVDYDHASQDFVVDLK